MRLMRGDLAVRIRADAEDPVIVSTRRAAPVGVVRHEPQVSLRPQGRVAEPPELVQVVVDVL